MFPGPFPNFSIANVEAWDGLIIPSHILMGTWLLLHAGNKSWDTQVLRSAPGFWVDCCIYTFPTRRPRELTWCFTWNFITGHQYHIVTARRLFCVFTGDFTSHGLTIFLVNVATEQAVHPHYVSSHGDKGVPHAFYTAYCHCKVVWQGLVKNQCLW